MAVELRQVQDKLATAEDERDEAREKLATVERDAFARGVRFGVSHGCSACRSLGIGETCGRCLSEIRALLSEPPRTGPELAAEHGFPPLAESGAARVPAVSESPRGEACTSECDEGYTMPLCPVHGTKEQR